MENNKGNTNNDSKLTQEDILEIRSKLTRDGVLILKKIYETPYIQHKTLYEVLNKTTNNLSNMIKKINDIKIDHIKISDAEPTFITYKKQETKKFYFLTNIGKQYVEWDLLQTEQSAKSHEDTGFRKNESAVKQTLDTLELFKKESDERWHFILYDLLRGKTENIQNNILAIYEKLMTDFCQCHIQKNNALQEILETLDDKQLTDQIQSYLSKRLYYYYHLEPLFSLNDTESYKIIDAIFSEMYPMIFSSEQNIDQPFMSSLSLEKYDNALVGIVKLSAEFIKEHYTKDDAVKKWHSFYFLNAALAFYVAEKCFMIIKHYQ